MGLRNRPRQRPPSGEVPAPEHNLG